MTTPAQIRAARELLGWSRMKLAFLANANSQRITYLVQFGKPVSAETHAMLINALEAEGIAFAKGGVRLGKPK